MTHRTKLNDGNGDLPEIRFLTANELAASCKQHEAWLRKNCRLERKSIVLRAGGYRYCIELSRCDTHEKLIEWVHHLNEKTWMTTQLMNRFLELCCKHHGLRLYNE